MITYDDARAALDTQLAAYQSTNVAFENTKFTPTEGVGYLRSFMLPVEPSQASVGANGLDLVEGIYQIDVAEPKEIGVGGVMRKVDAIVAQFSRGSNLSSNGVVLTIKRTWPGPAFTRDNFYVVPVSVSWYTYG